MRQSLLSRQWLLVAAFASLGVIATLPLVYDVIRSDSRTESTKPIGTVKLVCFDRNMQPQECAVSAPSSVAAR
ncbi:MAG: hypothetical protein EAZ21_06435 [Betaproteobacteria bacterium]|nr:MAG: hypothetical protein EAZ21_06435 [Betaproteobacteria bacterium]